MPGGVYDLSVVFRDSTGARLPPEGRRVVWDNGAPEYATLEGGIDARVTGVARGSTMLTATGSGATTYIGVDVEAPHFFSVVAGDRQSCGYTSFSVVYCWGSNVGHVLGAPIGTSSVAPLLIEGLEFMNMNAVVPGSGHICALTENGDAWCWGDGTVGQLGDGSSGGIAATPVPVSGGLGFSELRTHPIGRTVCGVAVTVACWGRNANGQVGDGTTDARNVPTIVRGPLLLHGVAVGARHTRGATTSVASSEMAAPRRRRRRCS